MKAIEKIYKVLDSDYSGYEISKAVGLNPSYISDLRAGRRKVETLKLNTVDKLETFYEENF